MSNYFSLVVLGVAAALQASVGPQIRILGGEPDLVFLVVLSWAINARLEDGVLWSFVGGITHDLLSAAPIGSSAISMILLVFLLDAIRQQVYRVSLPLLILLVMLGSFAHQIIHMLVLGLVGFELRLDNLVYVVIPTIAYNLIFIWPIYWFIRRLQRRLARNRRVSIKV
jgi:rod shape-determining protein MreD